MAKRVKRKKVRCPVCGQMVRLNSRGVIKSHSTGDIFSIWRQPQCMGTYRKPE